jgi:hypothetical protein
MRHPRYRRRYTVPLVQMPVHCIVGTDAGTLCRWYRCRYTVALVQMTVHCTVGTDAGTL